ncbi:hypothetical protein [uncultured Chryseobacterium sp.]|uniref:hypothetical protein n=1 Tax=uncultured Chryseobacterium sp. TaxID=259322 RepID=UPI00374849AE
MKKGKFFSIVVLLICIILHTGLDAQDPDTTIKTIERSSLENPDRSKALVKNLDMGALNDKQKIRVLFALTNSSNVTCKLSETLEYGGTTMVLAKKVKDTLTQIKLYGILGSLYQSINLNEKTKNYLDEAEKLMTAYRFPGALMYIKGNVYYLKGMNYAHTLDCEMAIRYFSRSIDIYRRNPSKMSAVNLKLAYLNKGFCEIELGQNTNAAQTLQFAQPEYNRTVEPNSYPKFFAERQKLFVKFGNAKIDAKKKQYDISNTLLLDLLNEERNKNTNFTRTEVLKQLAENYYHLGRYEESDRYEKMYFAEEDPEKRKQDELLNYLISENKKSSDALIGKLVTKEILLLSLMGILGGFIILYLIKKAVGYRQKYQKIKNDIFII